MFPLRVAFEGFPVQLQISIVREGGGGEGENRKDDIEESGSSRDLSVVVIEGRREATKSIRTVERGNGREENCVGY